MGKEINGKSSGLYEVECKGRDLDIKDGLYKVLRLSRGEDCMSLGSLGDSRDILRREGDVNFGVYSKLGINLGVYQYASSN